MYFGTPAQLFLDDQRCGPIWQSYNDDLPPNWIICRSVELAKYLAGMIYFDKLSLDHDMGQQESGYDFLKWYLDMDRSNFFLPETIIVHSQNPVGAEAMLQYARNWKEVHKVNFNLDYRPASDW